jgi:FkbM family methyltransferase
MDGPQSTVTLPVKLNNSFPMKMRFVGTNFGRLALIVRNTVELLRATYLCPESIGTLANDQLATHLVTRLCLPKKGFIDVGAHIGSIIDAVLHYDSSIGVYAVEPITTKIENLRLKFPTIELYQCVLGESDGDVPFFVNAKQSGYSSLERPRNIEETDVITVPMKRLDSLILSGEIDVIKIDVEGAELGVLRGGEVLIERNRPLVMFESGPYADDSLGYSKELMWRWLEERNFEIVVPNRVAHNGPGLSLDGFLESHFYPRRTTNYFAIPGERRIEIRDRARIVLQIMVT